MYSLQKKALLFIIFVLPLIVSSQINNRIWYFGENAGLRFTDTGTDVINGGMINTSASSATVCNDNDSLLFYTDGVTVYNSAHGVMQNGTGLNGYKVATQGALIAEKPGDSTRFYIFTTSYDGSTPGLFYSEVDMTLDNGKGGIISGNKNIHLLSSVLEKLTGIIHKDGDKVWIITQKYNTADFYAYQITSTGVNTTPVISSIGGVRTGTRGCIKPSLDGKRLVACYYQEAIVNLYNLNNSTGAITDQISLTGISTPYGAEFSPSGKMLYISNGNQIVQFNVKAGNSTAINNSKTVISSESGMYGIQMGPDSVIILAKQGTNMLGAIKEPNKTGTDCDYRFPYGFLGKNKCKVALPNFVYDRTIDTTKPVTASYNYTTDCSYTVEFHETASSNVSDFFWDFGDTSIQSDTSILEEPTYTYSTNGTYSVSLIVTNGYQSDTITKSIVVNKAVIAISLGNDTTVCSAANYTLDATNSGATYIWSGGETTATVTPASTNTYSVTVTNGGCTVTDAVDITYNQSPDANAGRDTVIEKGKSVQLDGSGGTQSSTYIWTPTTTLNDFIIKNPIASPTVTTTYILTIKSGQCIDRDTVIVIVDDATSSVRAGFNFASDCSLQVDFKDSSSSNASIYKWDFGDLSTDSDTSNVHNPSYTYPSSGTYTAKLKVMNTFGKVDSLEKTVIINYSSLSVDIGNDTTLCSNESYTLDATTTGATYLWSSGGETTATITASTTGNYVVTVTSGGCPAHDSVYVTSIPVPIADAGKDSSIFIDSTIQLFGNGGDITATYSWTPTGSLDNGFFQNPKASPTVDTDYILLVTNSSNSKSCSDYDTTTIFVIDPSAPVTADFTFDINCSLTVGFKDSSSSNTTSFEWDFGDASSLYNTSTTQNPVHVFSNSGTFSVKLIVSNQYGKVDTITKTVAIVPMPVAEAKSDTTIERGIQVQLYGSGGDSNAKYSWTPVSTLNDSLNQNPKATPVLEGKTTYTLVVTNSNGSISCTSSDEVIITTFIPEGKIFVANIFSPNGDYINDELYVQGREIQKSNFTFIIYDRWGDKIFETSNPDEGWDGTKKGNDLNPAVFMYVVTGIYTDGTPIELKGNVTLIR